MSLEELKSKAGGYAFTGSTVDAPYIYVNIYNVTAEALDSAVTVYLNKADEYASSFTEALGVREYIVDRLQKDLAGECLGLTSGGINKEENTIVMHEKANDVYTLAAKNLSINGATNIRSIMDNYASIHSAICLNDDGTETSLQPVYIESENNVYDERAVSIEFGEESRKFINDNPGYTGIDKTYTAYETSIEDDICVNTSAYSLGHYDDIVINSETIVTGWFIRNSGNVAVAYAESIEGPYNTIEINSSSSDGSDESSEEPSDESSEEPSEEPSETESSESESSEEP